MDPIELAREIEARYRRYLQTTFYFKDPALRKSFADALASGRLSNGPFIEATPVFSRGSTAGELFRELLGRDPEAGFLKAVHGGRRLYTHQEQAIRKVFAGRNVVVATGTGSGKTEAFLYPILLHLYQEFTAGELCPGVRALILYPMNALANDQRERLAAPPMPTSDPGILWTLEQQRSLFQFTFGQYIGATPDNENDSRRHARDLIASRLPGELVLRSQMQDTPPHILLTNYSMLEYLLLRPDDSPLFDEGRAKWWTFLVLDEAHQYRGSRGIEMAMLLRRLKRRLREGGREGSFRCIATSATLAGGEADKAAVAEFAADLFGEEFSADDVLLGKTEPIPETGPTSFAADDYRALLEHIDKDDRKAKHFRVEIASRLGQQTPFSGTAAEMTGWLLERDMRAHKVRLLITGAPSEVQSVADEVFGDLTQMHRVGALAELIALLQLAKSPEGDAPLLSARYHLFIRSLEGAFVSYWPEKKIFLDRKAVTQETAAFEVALCRECGQHYFVAKKDQEMGKLAEAVRDASHGDFGATYLRPIENDGVTGDEDEDGQGANRQVYRLCVQCGELARGESSCGHRNSIRIVKEAPPDDEDRADQLGRCGVCGYNAAGRDPVREVVYGTDGPHAVIATTLHQNLPENRRKVLAFTDGRQEAAFFAWYLDDSYRGILDRHVLLRIVRDFVDDATAGSSLRTIADRAGLSLGNAFKRRESDDEPTIRKNIWRAIYREFLTDEQRISLEGVGLVKWTLALPHWVQIPDSMHKAPWNLSEQEAPDLIAVLFDTMRTGRGVELRMPEDVALGWRDLDLRPAQRAYRIGPARTRNANITAWDGRTGTRARLLVKLLVRAGHRTDADSANSAQALLRDVWEAVRRSDQEVEPKDALLQPSGGDAMLLNPDWWRLRPLQEEDIVFECSTCGRLQPVSVRGICLRFGCPGTLRELRCRDLQPDHYRALYQENLPGVFRVEEHTAQLHHEKAREFQRDFREGRIHVLSCSTTFELGVDLGNLDTVFLRNVPPEAFNYAQRVGRAGRRSGHPGFAITYCRRNPHDLYYAANPQLMLSGRTRPPMLSLKNEKIILRHVVATVLSVFFRANPTRFRNVGSFVGDFANPIAIADLATYLQDHRAELEESLRAIVPNTMLAAVGLEDASWMDNVAGDASRFSDAQATVSSDYVSAATVKETAKAADDFDTAKWAKGRMEDIAREDVLSFLSRMAVIPKYGFPVDVVELDTQRSSSRGEAVVVSLQRDLAIAVAEFAPSSELVANKKKWTSYGLKRVAERPWPRWWYARCPVHNRFERRGWQSGQGQPTFDTCCARMRVTQYIDPKFGFVTNLDKPEEPKQRPARVFTTRPYFAGFKEREGEKIELGSITLTTVSPGYMVVVCEGRRGEGFYICPQCGFGDKKYRRDPHKTPSGETCSANPSSLRPEVSLGHDFVTDVLKIQFHPSPPDGVEPIWFAYSLAYALVEGGAAEVLDVPANDLNATVAHNEEFTVPPIILYDNVPGGAGLVARLQDTDMLKECLESSLRRVDGDCRCADDTSCYGCLRSYRNQFAHLHLKRGPVKHYLETILKG